MRPAAKSSAAKTAAAKPRRRAARAARQSRITMAISGGS